MTAEKQEILTVLEAVLRYLAFDLPCQSLTPDVEMGREALLNKVECLCKKISSSKNEKQISKKQEIHLSEHANEDEIYDDVVPVGKQEDLQHCYINEVSEKNKEEPTDEQNEQQNFNTMYDIADPGEANQYHYIETSNQQMNAGRDIAECTVRNDELLEKLKRMENTNVRISYLRIVCKDPICSGYVFKQKKKMLSKWKRCYCIVQDYFMFFYKSKSDQKSNGVIVLPIYTIEIESKLVFTLTPKRKGRSYSFQLSTETERDKWVHVLSQICSETSSSLKRNVFDSFANHLDEKAESDQGSCDSGLIQQEGDMYEPIPEDGLHSILSSSLSLKQNQPGKVDDLKQALDEKSQLCVDENYGKNEINQIHEEKHKKSIGNVEDGNPEVMYAAADSEKEHRREEKHGLQTYNDGKYEINERNNDEKHGLGETEEEIDDRMYAVADLEETKYSDESGNANEEISTETEDVQQPQFTYNELIQKLERLENTNSRISYLRITCKDPLISGYLLKQKKKMLSKWHGRYCIVQDVFMFFYKSQKDKRSLGVIVLPIYNIQIESKTILKLTPKKKGRATYLFQLSSGTERDKWLKVLSPICYRKLSSLKQNVFNCVAKQLDEKTESVEDGAVGASFHEEGDMYEPISDYGLHSKIYSNQNQEYSDNIDVEIYDDVTSGQAAAEDDECDDHVGNIIRPAAMIEDDIYEDIPAGQSSSQQQQPTLPLPFVPQRASLLPPRRPLDINVLHCEDKLPD